MAQVEFQGAVRLIARLAKWDPAVDAAAASGVKEVAGKIRDSARAKVRKDTRSLEKSIRVGEYARPAGDIHSIRVTAGGYIRNPKTGRLVDYAVHQELGTSRMADHPYLGPAVQEHGRELTKAIKKGIQQ